MSGNFDVFSISALYVSMFFYEGELIYWEHVFECHQPLPRLTDHCWFPHFFDRAVIILSLTFSVSCLYSIGNVSLVSRLILDAGLTAELVKVWSEQTVWVPECHSFIVTCVRWNTRNERKSFLPCSRNNEISILIILIFSYSLSSVFFFRNMLYQWVIYCDKDVVSKISF